MTDVRNWLWLCGFLLFAELLFDQSPSLPRNEIIAYEHGLGPGQNILFDVDIYSANADGSNAETLTHNAHFNRLLAWSPDGRQIAFESRESVQTQTADELDIIDRDGGNARELRLDPATIRAAWDDGKHVVQAVHLFISSATWRQDQTFALTFADPFLRPDGVHVYPTFLVKPDGSIQNAVSTALGALRVKCPCRIEKNGLTFW